MTDEQADTDERKEELHDYQPSMKYNIQLNREIIKWYAHELKTLNSTLHAIEQRYLAKLIAAEGTYEEELRAVFPDL